MAVEVDHRVEVVGMEPSHFLVDARTEALDVHVHPAHVVDAFEPIAHFDRTARARRRRKEHARFADRLAEDRRKAVRRAGREARTEREPFDDHHDRRDLALPSSDPPAGAFDLGLVDIRERVCGHQAIALEERARLVGGRVSVDLYLWKRRCRGHRSSLVGLGPSGPPPVATWRASLPLCRGRPC